MDRSFSKVKEIITNLSGIQEETSYHIPRKNIDKLENVFPGCNSEPLVRKINKCMEEHNIDTLVLTEDELRVLFSDITECISRRDYGTDVKPGLIDWVFRSNKMNRPYMQNIEEFLGTPLNNLVSTGDLASFIRDHEEGKLENYHPYVLVQAAIASQNVDAYNWIIENIDVPSDDYAHMAKVDFSESDEISSDNLPFIEYSLLMACYYGSIEIIQRIIQLIRAQRDGEYIFDLLTFGLGCASRAGQADTIRYILDNYPNIRSFISTYDVYRNGIKLIGEPMTDEFLQYLRRYSPKNQGEVTATIQAWYDAVPDDNINYYIVPTFIDEVFNGFKDGIITLDRDRLAAFVETYTINTIAGSRIFRRIMDSFPLKRNPYSLISKYPLNVFEPVLDKLPPFEVDGEDNMFPFFVEKPDSTPGHSDSEEPEAIQEAINSTFDHPEGYYDYFNRRGFKMNVVYYKPETLDSLYGGFDDEYEVEDKFYHLISDSDRDSGDDYEDDGDDY
jgi:hypothetical protein